MNKKYKCIFCGHEFDQGRKVMNSKGISRVGMIRCPKCGEDHLIDDVEIRRV